MGIQFQKLYKPMFKNLILAAFASAAHAALSKAEIEASATARVAQDGGCTDTNDGYADSYGDACDWYDDYGCDGAETWITENFYADFHCCACGGGCDDINYANDSFDDGC